MGAARKFRPPKIVSEQDRFPFWLRALLFFLLLLGVAWVGYQQGSDGSPAALVGLPPDAKHQIELLEQERNALRRELKMVKQAAEIDRESIIAIRDQIKQFQDERLKMEEELAFLRGIVSTDSKKKGLRVQGFKLEPGLEAGHYVYKFSVSQVINSGIIAKGSIGLTILGLHNGQSKQLSLSQVSAQKLDKIKMRFRYFQNVEGKLKIPEGFEPATIEVEVKPSSKKLQPVKESYNWSPIS
jgi:hypothetical protein